MILKAPDWIPGNFMAWSSLAQVPNMEKQCYEKQHHAVQIPTVSGLPEMVTTACFLRGEGMTLFVTVDRHIISLHMHNSCISDSITLRQIALTALGSHYFSTVLSIVSHHITSPDNTHT